MGVARDPRTDSTAEIPAENFTGHPEPTIGVEWEIAFTDPVTRDLTPVAGEVLDLIDKARPGHRVQREFLANTVELVTGVHHTVPEAVAELREQLNLVRGAAEKVGANVWASGSHPFARGVSQPVSPKGHYAEIQERTQWWGRQMMIWGLHVHVAVKDADRVWPIINALMTYFPHILGLSASSPAWNAEDMGYASNRTMLYQQLPTASLPPQLQTWQQWQDYMRDQALSGVISHTRSMHLDIRPASKFGTIEIRIADAPSNLYELGAITALIQTLVVWLDRRYDAGEELPWLQTWHLEENKWRAARYGMAAEIIVDRNTRESMVAEELIELIDELMPVAEELGCAEELASIEPMLKIGAGYQRQRKAAQAAGAVLLLPDSADVTEIHLPWMAAVDLSVAEMAADHPL